MGPVERPNHLNVAERCEYDFFRRYIEHTLRGEQAQEARNQAFKAGFKIAAPDARVTMNDDETEKCTAR